MSDVNNERQIMGWAGFICQSCGSYVLVGILPVGWSSIAIPTCPAANLTSYACEGRLQEMDTDSLSEVFETLTPEVNNGP